LVVSCAKEHIMKIGIIGAGSMGGTLARRLTALGHDVSMANSRGPATLAELAAEAGAVPVSITEAGRDADVMIIAIPERNIPDLPEGLLDPLPEGGVVIDIGNYAPQQRDGRIDELENGVVESRWVEGHLGHPVIKAFNNVRPPSLVSLGKPAGTPGRVALPVAGDDAGAKAVVLGLIDQLGFDGIDAGGLDESWRQQPGTPVYCTDLDLDGAEKALAAATRGRTAEWRA
jgi:predicted dinucleotide-binding enzyme